MKAPPGFYEKQIVPLTGDSPEARQLAIVKDADILRIGGKPWLRKRIELVMTRYKDWRGTHARQN
jgi:hypothetical protein